jgi:hypothetical protein
MSAAMRFPLSISALAAVACLVAASSAALAQPIADPLPNLSGTWVEVHVLSEILSFPIVGRVESTNEGVLRTEIMQTGSALSLSGRYCAIEVAIESPLAWTGIPDSFLASFGQQMRPATIEASSERTRFVLDWYAEVNGARLSDPHTEPLPRSCDDPRVVDADGDGHPGVTLLARVLGVIEGEVYVVQRVRYRLVGTLVSPDRIEGLIEWTGEHVVLGASSPLLAVDTPSGPHDDPERSRFVLVRVRPGTMCEEIRNGWRDLCAQ